MKKVFTIVFVGSILTFAGCQTKPKTEEAAMDSTTAMPTDTTTMADSTAPIAIDSTEIMPADSVK